MRRLLILAATLSIGLPAVAHAWQPISSSYATWPGSLPWYLSTSSTSQSMNNSTVQSVLIDAYEEWEAPSCSGFQHNFLGGSSLQAGITSDSSTVHGFAQTWPFAWGDPGSTLGITLSVWSGSTYLSADVIFNEQEYTWVNAQPDPCYIGDVYCEADLQSVATHEFGHSLGLGHTNSSGATMLPTILPGTQSRSIASDDISGVCSLYPGTGDDDDSTPPPDDDDSTPPIATDDGNEDDDAWDEATDIDCGDVISATAIDQDWFSFETTATGPITVNLDWSTSSVDLDLYLYNSTATIGESLAGNTDNEQVSIGSSSAGNYWIAVFPYSGSDDYTLELICSGGPVSDDDDSTPPTDDDDSTPPVGDDGFENNDDQSTGASITCPTTITGFAGDQDWFVFETTSSGNIAATLTWPDTATDLDLYLFDEQLNTLDYSEEYSPVVLEEVAQSNAAAGVYSILVNNWQGEDWYELEIECSGGGDDDDATTPDDDDDTVNPDDDDTVNPDDDDASDDDDDDDDDTVTPDDDDASDDDDNGSDDDDNGSSDDDDDNGGNSRRGGCSCSVGEDAHAGLALAGLLLLGIRRRR